jgi:tol-pal system protein YbgF
MIRRSFLPQARSTVLLVLLSMTAAIPVVRAQDASTQERLDRLERDLSMLQRQVYRATGGEAPPGAESGGSTAVDLQVRMDRLEQQMRDLTGRVEDETNQVQQLRQRLEQINSDIEVRLDQGQGQDAGAVPRPRAPASALAGPELPPLAQPAALTPYGRPPPPPADTGTLTPPGPLTGMATPYPGPTQLMPPRMASAGGSDTLRPPGSDTMPPASASAQYNSAFGLLRKADYPAAEEALRSFLQQHPSDPLAGNAQYWLGESFYARGKYTEAAAAFADGYKRYPRGPKAADGLLKLGMSLARANQKHNACIALMQLDHDFPHPGSAVKDRATQEKKKLGC